MKFYFILVLVLVLVHFSNFQLMGGGETGFKSQKSGLLTDLGGKVGVGMGDVIQNQTSPDFKFPEVGISAYNTPLSVDLDVVVDCYAHLQQLKPLFSNCTNHFIAQWYG